MRPARKRPGVCCPGWYGWVRTPLTPLGPWTAPRCCTACLTCLPRSGRSTSSPSSGSSPSTVTPSGSATRCCCTPGRSWGSGSTPTATGCAPFSSSPTTPRRGSVQGVIIPCCTGETGSPQCGSGRPRLRPVARTLLQGPQNSWTPPGGRNSEASAGAGPRSCSSRCSLCWHRWAWRGPSCSSDKRCLHRTGTSPGTSQRKPRACGTVSPAWPNSSVSSPIRSTPQSAAVRCSTADARQV